MTTTPDETAARLDGFFARIFVLSHMTARGVWGVALTLCVLAGLVAGAVGFANAQGELFDRLFVGIGYWLLAEIALGLALAVLRGVSVVGLLFLRVVLDTLFWLITGRQSAIHRARVRF